MGRSDSNSEPSGETRIEDVFSDIAMAPKTEDKEELIEFMWGQNAVLTISFSQNESVQVAPAMLCHFTRIEGEWLEIKRSVLVAYDEKTISTESKTKGNIMKLEQRGFTLHTISTFFTCVMYKILKEHTERVPRLSILGNQTMEQEKKILPSPVWHQF